jgi:hypothetical protein
VPAPSQISNRVRRQRRQNKSDRRKPLRTAAISMSMAETYMFSSRVATRRPPSHVCRALEMATAMKNFGAFDFSVLTSIVGNRTGISDVACPACGPLKARAISAQRQVLRIWYECPDFVSYCCARCGARGWAANEAACDIDRYERQTRQADARGSAHPQNRQHVARWLWESAKPIDGTLAERYLRIRGVACSLPTTLRFLPERGRHAPACFRRSRRVVARPARCRPHGGARRAPHKAAR